MSFNSLEYLWFLPSVFILYWFVFKQLRWQNLFIVIASYLFYGWWDWRFLILIAFTTLCSFGCGLGIESSKAEGNKKKALAYSTLNIVANLLVLGTFKYLDFFSESFISLAHLIGWHLDLPTLKLLLPVGISFYTFQALSYTIDVYRGRIKAAHDPIPFFAYISFFPQLVAGPIEKSTNLLPQFYKERTFDEKQARDGMRQMLWGFFKKLVIADNCAIYVMAGFNNYTHLNGLELLLVLLLFGLQMYGDFSGYSDIAIGSAKLFNIRLSRNFNAPFFSRDMSEFWRHWHISLNSWFFEYIFIPLGGWNKKWKVLRNVIVVFGLCGLWHGAAWKYVVWGLYFGLLSLPYFLHIKVYKTQIVAQGKQLPSWTEAGQMLRTIVLIVFGMAFFRAQDLTQAVHYLYLVVRHIHFPWVSLHCSTAFVIVLLLFVLVEWLQREKQHPLEITDILPYRAARFALYYGLLVTMYFFYVDTTQFVYFQF